MYHTMLADGPVSLQSHVLHTIVPLGFLLDWLLFDAHGAFRLRDVPGWVVYPLAYVPVTMTLALVDGFYPYPFLDAAGLGYGGAALNVLGLLVAFSGLGVIYVVIDRLLSRRPAAQPTAMVRDAEQ